MQQTQLSIMHMHYPYHLGCACGSGLPTQQKMARADCEYVTVHVAGSVIEMTPFGSSWPNVQHMCVLRGCAWCGPSELI